MTLHIHQGFPPRIVMREYEFYTYTHVHDHDISSLFSVLNTLNLHKW